MFFRKNKSINKRKAKKKTCIHKTGYPGQHAKRSHIYGKINKKKLFQLFVSIIIVYIVTLLTVMHIM